MNDERQDRRLDSLLGAVRADASPAIVTRVRARIEARRRVPRLIGWAMRPVALGASLALLVASAGLSLVLVASAPEVQTGDSGGVIESILVERGIQAGDNLTVPERDGVTAGDSGSAR
jgi:hypothetical protein